MSAMSVTTLEAPVRPRRPVRRAAPQPRISPPLHPGRGSGRQARPRARPSRRLSAPSLAPVALPEGRRCVPVPRAAAWRLTDRGLAVIMVTGLMIVAAAVAVIGLTALRVTGDSYQPYQTSVSSH